MFDVTTIGEIMLRLSVPIGVRIETAAQFDVLPGGAEANVTAALARLGLRTAWCGALPDSPLGRLAANHLRMAGVNLEGVHWCGEGRMGVYFVEFASPPRATQVIYDRADSCAARMTPAQVHWEHLLNTRLIHLTGITPALSSGCLEVIKETVRRARERGAALSFDVNYRARLWSAEEAVQTLAPLIEGCDLLFCNRSDAARLFGLEGPAEETVQRLAARTHARITVMAMGAEGAVAWDGAQVHHQPALPTAIVDRLGAGDGLAAGVLYGWLSGDLRLGLRYGVALAALALSQQGDMIVTTRQEVESLLAGREAILR